jgi:hypothetical protein
VSLDLYIMRQAADAFNQTGRMNTDWVAVVDEWAHRFLVGAGWSRGHVFVSRKAMGAEVLSSE